MKPSVCNDTEDEDKERVEMGRTFEDDPMNQSGISGGGHGGHGAHGAHGSHGNGVPSTTPTNPATGSGPTVSGACAQTTMITDGSGNLQAKCVPSAKGTVPEDTSTVPGPPGSTNQRVSTDASVE